MIDCDVSKHAINSKFNRYDGKDIDPTYKTSELIKSTPGLSKMKCISDCNLDCSCSIFIYEDQNCQFFTQSSVSHLVDAPNSKHVFIRTDIYVP